MDITTLENKIFQTMMSQLNKLDKKVDICYNRIEEIISSNASDREIKRQLNEVFGDLRTEYLNFLIALFLDVQRRVDKTNEPSLAIVSSWLGANYQQRVDTLMTNVQAEVVKCYKLNKVLDDVSPRLNKSRNYVKNSFKRIARTESNKVLNDTYKNKLQREGATKYSIKAIIDSRTSEICREMNGRVFNMKDYEVGITAPPFHPNCRSVIEEVK